MARNLSVLGVPSSAGAYAPGQEKAPAALRGAGLIESLRSAGLEVQDLGDTVGFRWRPDSDHPSAMNVPAVEKVARETATLVEEGLANDSAVLVIGGDCTVELGSVAGALAVNERTGLVYVDLDADLNTPASTSDGALDWMGVGHLLGQGEVVQSLARLGPRVPMLAPSDVFFFAYRNLSPYERGLFVELGLRGVRAEEVAADPTAAVGHALRWARDFDQIIVHFDVDTIDYAEFPIAENTRRHVGLGLETAMTALTGLLRAPGWRVLTVTEINPDHGDEDGSTVGRFVDTLAEALSSALRGNPTAETP